MPDVARTLLLFVLAGLCELGGGWLIWQWLREDRAMPLGLIGALVLISYGVVHTLQSESEFSRIYIAYGALFIVLAMGWGMLIDGWRPDRWDISGALLALVGVFVIMFAPRSA